MPAVTRPHSTLVAPPEGNARPIEAEMAVHELRMAKARPSMDSGEKFLLSSCFLPRAASCWSSDVRPSCGGAMLVPSNQLYARRGGSGWLDEANGKE
jgi:hypothetical protein